MARSGVYDVKVSSALYIREKVAPPKTRAGKLRGPNLSYTVNMNAEIPHGLAESCTIPMRHLPQADLLRRLEHHLLRALETQAAEN